MRCLNMRLPNGHFRYVTFRFVAASLALMAGMACGGMDEAAVAQADAASGQAGAADAANIWWKHALVYEIYPRSFGDSNGDGVGDLNGITARLDYVKSIGVDAIWIAPMYPSPQVDFGYDISNYVAVDPQYGTLADFDRMVAEGKKRDIRIVLDMVVNHTSDKHQWFIDAASSRTNPKHDWYIWNDGIPGTGPAAHEGKVPPNNWISTFGGSAWEWVPAVHQYYYHFFYKAQPDLNWRNPVVEKAMFDSMRFWLDRGVAGFRLDAVPTLFEDTKLTDEKALGGTNKQGDPQLEETNQVNLPEVHDTMRRMRAMIDSYPGNRVLIGETYLPNTAELDKWYGGEKQDELQLPMDMLFGFHGDKDKLDAAGFRAHLTEAETQLHGSQPLYVFDNHDNVRSIDRYGDGVHNAQIAKLLTALLFTVHGTALTYYGEELGMPTMTPTRREDVKDPIGITGWPKEKGRDGERTPMQWDGSNAQAGFSPNPKTWLPVPANYKTLNVKAESADPESQLSWWRQLATLRRTNPALHSGGMTMLDAANPDVLSFVRTTGAGQSSVVVALNCTGEAKTVSLEVPGNTVKTLLSNEASLRGVTSLKSITLPPYASWVGSVE